MKLVALLLSLLLAVVPTEAWAAGSAYSAATAARGGGGYGASSSARSAYRQALPSRPAVSTRGQAADRTSARTARPAHQGGLSSGHVEREFGIPARNQQALQRFADRRGLVIDVRPTNPASVEWLNKGALPKPMEIKAKTVNSHDLMLSRDLPRDSQGLVALFKPTLPERPPSFSDHQWSGLKARYKQRLDEWKKLAPVIGKGNQEGRYRVTASGRVEGLDGKGAWQPITGDHDLFEIRRTDGARLPRREEDAVIREMKDRNIGVQHGPHMSWDPPAGSWERTKIFEPIMQSHKPGGEALVRFAPGKQPRRAWASSPVDE